MKIKKLSICALTLMLALAGKAHSGEPEKKPIYEGQSGNGSSGDPYLIAVTSFPDKQKLEEAMKLAENKLLNSNLPQSLINSTISEMKSLASKNKYVYLENIASWPTSTSYARKNKQRIIGYGAVTEPYEGSVIFFSKRVLDYDLESFTKLLIHEILHHTLRYSLSQDEELVELFAKQIMIGQLQPELVSAISKGIYIREGVVPVRQIFEYWDRIPETNGKMGSKSTEVCPIRQKGDPFGLKLCLEGASFGVGGMNMERQLSVMHMQEQLNAKNFNNLPDGSVENAWDLPLVSVSYALGREIARVYDYKVTLPDMAKAYEGYEVIRQMALDLGYADPLKKWPNKFCKKKPRFFGGCRKADEILMKDLFQ
ncbi:MAG: hypothetical protein V4596_07690 [Bdellovibrionota bacterium]